LSRRQTGGGLDPLPLRERALSADVAARLDATTAEFHALQVTQRPTFMLENRIGDRAVFSGVIRAEPLVAAMEAMLADAAASGPRFARRRDPRPRLPIMLPDPVPGSAR
jgi:predicted DsbA family dithiol-disulfide isomerase